MNNKWILRSILIATLALAVFFVYDNYLSPFAASLDIVGDLISDENVTVTSDPELTFTPADREPTVGLILYTGARVDPDAYASIARQVADEGSLVVIVKHPLNLPVLGVSKATDVIRDHPEITSWYIGGHSLGGAMAAEFAERNSRIDGLVLMAAYPGESTNLAFRGMPTLVAYGTQDLIASQSEIELAAEQLLPKSAELLLIEGANHAQFGSYGPQADDGAALISRQDQQHEVASAIIRMLRR